MQWSLTVSFQTHVELEWYQFNLSCQPGHTVLEFPPVKSYVDGPLNNVPCIYLGKEQKKHILGLITAHDLSGFKFLTEECTSI